MKNGWNNKKNSRFRKIHRLGLYLIVQSQYVLVNKWALQVEENKDNNNNIKKKTGVKSTMQVA